MCSLTSREAFPGTPPGDIKNTFCISPALSQPQIFLHRLSPSLVQDARTHSCTRSAHPKAMFLHGVAWNLRKTVLMVNPLYRSWLQAPHGHPAPALSERQGEKLLPGHKTMVATDRFVGTLKHFLCPFFRKGRTSPRK